jgi:hypothetical protein
MRRIVLIGLLAASAGAAAWAQETPHDFKQDTPPVPGQVVERPRDELRLAPLPLREAQLENTGLPRSGPMGLAREPRGEQLYRPRAAR